MNPEFAAAISKLVDTQLQQLLATYPDLIRSAVLVLDHEAESDSVFTYLAVGLVIACVLSLVVAHISGDAENW